jgi:tetratricopeptide (TPR) repeat protein
MPPFDPDQPEDRLLHEAEELMRQRRFQDAVSRYQDLRRQSPTDLWANLGYVSALECAGNVAEAEQALEEAMAGHRRSAPLHRFRHLFFVRREDLRRAALSQEALSFDIPDEGPEDQLADLYFNQGRYHEARGELERLLRDGVLDREDRSDMKASVVARIGACLRQSGEFEAGRERLVEALALEPGNHWTLSELAECERALGNIAQARRRYREALEANGDDHWTRGHLAQLECEDGNLEEATKLYEQILAVEPKAAWAKVELAQVVAEADQERAHQLLNSALEDDPNYPWAHAQLGNLARRAGRLDEARAHYQRAAAAAPSATWVLHEQADICRQLGRFEEAYTHLEHARGLNPYDAVTYGYFADLLRHEGKHREALANLEKAVEIDPAYTWAWREQAELKGLAGRHDDAEAAYKKACELEPGEAINDGLKAFLLRCQGRRDAAIPYLERAVETQKDYLWAWRERIDHAFVAGRLDQAESVARQALVALPDTPPLMALLAEALRKQGRRKEAAEIATKALGIAPEAPQLWAIRAEIAAEDGDLVEALKAARRAAELDRGADYQALHAHLLMANGQEAQADPIITALLAAPQPVLAAYELAAALAERRGQRDQAIRWCTQALAGAYADEPRLLVRRARLQLVGMDVSANAAEAAAIVAPLPALFERGGSVPWRELAQVFATVRQPVLARRAAHQHLQLSGPGDQGRAWLSLAELELSLGHTRDAQQALDQALKHDAQALPALILGAVLAEQRGELAQAIGHLERLDRVIADTDPGAEAGTSEAVLHRQLAVLYERAERHGDAEAMWVRIIADHPEHLVHQAERCGFLLRRGRSDEAKAAAKDLVPKLLEKHSEATETQRLLKDLAIQAASADGARAGIAVLLAADGQLVTTNRLLLIQLAMLADDRELAARQLDLVEQTEPTNRHARLQRIRLLAQGREYERALELSQVLWRDAPDDQEVATLHAECLAVRGRTGEALDLLDRALASSQPSIDAGLVAALLALEVHGEAACLARLGRLSVPTTRPPVARVLIAAWPQAWGTPDPAQPATRSDLQGLPPFPRLAGRLAAALGRAGRHDLAASLLHVVASAAARQGNWTERRRLSAAAVAHLIRAGQRGQAWRAAWAGRSIMALLRCLLP